MINKTINRLINFITCALIILASLLIINLLNNTNKHNNSTVDNFDNFAIKTAYADSQKSPEIIAPNFTLIDYEPGITTTLYILVNFIDFPTSTFSDNDISRIKKNFNDNISNNDTFSVHEYMFAQSQGKLNVWALFMEYTTTREKAYYENNTDEVAFSREVAIFNESLNVNTGDFIYNSQIIKNFHCRINYFAGDATNYNSSFWPKNWVSYDDTEKTVESSGLIMYTQKIKGDTYQKYVGVMSHELMHLMGIADYYLRVNNNNFHPVGEWDIMGTTSYDYPQSMSPYFRQQVGWFEESYAYDNIDSQIEYISSSGTYTINESTANKDSLAYKFGLRNGIQTEFFMIEFKYKNNYDNCSDYSTLYTGLIVYRINETQYKGNIESTNPSNCGMYIFRDNPSINDNNTNGYKKCIIVDANDTNIAKYLKSYGSINDSDSNIISYVNGDNSKVVIDNLHFNSSSQSMTFDIEFVNEKYSTAGYVKKDGSPVSNINILVNGTNTGKKTDENGYYFLTNLDKNDIVSFQKSGLVIENTFTITKDKIDNNVNLITLKDLKFTVSHNSTALNNVEVFVNGDSKGYTNSVGEINVTEIALNSVITFAKDKYDFDPSSVTFSDINTVEYQINATYAVRDLTISFVINGIPLVDEVGIMINNIIIATSNSSGIANIKDVHIDSIIKFSNVNYTFNPTILTFSDMNTVNFEIITTEIFVPDDDYNISLKIVDFDYDNTIANDVPFTFKINEVETNNYIYKNGVWKLKVETSDIIKIENENYKTITHTVSMGNINNPQPVELKICKYFSYSFKVVDIFDKSLPNITLTFDEDTVTSNNSGMISYNGLITGDVIVLSGEYIDSKSVTLDAKSLQSEIEVIYKQVDILIAMQKFNGTKVLIEDVSIKVNGTSITTTPSVENNKLKMKVRYCDEISFEKPNYVLDSLTVLTDNLNQEYLITAKIYCSISGNVTIKNSERLNLYYKIYSGDTLLGITDNNGVFIINNLLEGTTIKFIANNYQSKNIIVDSSASELIVEATLIQNNSIGLYIIIAIFVIMLLLNFWSSIEKLLHRKKRINY